MIAHVVGDQGLKNAVHFLGAQVVLMGFLDVFHHCRLEGLPELIFVAALELLDPLSVDVDIVAS